jgi:hypothetical protein
MSWQSLRKERCLAADRRQLPAEGIQTVMKDAHGADDDDVLKCIHKLA